MMSSAHELQVLRLSSLNHTEANRNVLDADDCRVARHVLLRLTSLACGVQTPLTPALAEVPDRRRRNDTQGRRGDAGVIDQRCDHRVDTAGHLTIADATAQFKSQAFNYDVELQPIAAPSSPRGVRPATRLPRPATLTTPTATAGHDLRGRQL